MNTHKRQIARKIIADIIADLTRPFEDIDMSDECADVRSAMVEQLSGPFGAMIERRLARFRRVEMLHKDLVYTENDAYMSEEERMAMADKIRAQIRDLEAAQIRDMEASR